MELVFHVAAAVAAVIHVAFFAVESLLWGTNRINQRFRLTEEEARVLRPFAFNQGFYNLFLAIGVGVGLMLGGVAGTTLLLFGCASMAGAGVVLFLSAKHLRVGAIVQLFFPAIALAGFGLSSIG